MANPSEGTPTPPHGSEVPPVDTSVPVHGAENFAVSEGAAAVPVEERVAVTREDLRAPEQFEQGEVLIIPIVNVKDIRDPKDVEKYQSEIGALYPDQAKEFSVRIKAMVDELLEKTPESEREKLDIVFLAGETDLVTPGEGGLHNEHQRAVETGDIAIQAVRESLQEHGVDPDKAMITHNGRAVSITHLDDTRLLHSRGAKGNDEYLDKLLEKYGNDRKLWMVYEDDTEKATREALNAEGPTELADRTNNALDMCSTVADLCQREDPNRRVIVFALGHYDNLSPWVKKYAMGVNPAESFVPMEKGGGFIIHRKADRTASTTIGKRTFPVKLESVV